MESIRLDLLKAHYQNKGRLSDLLLNFLTEIKDHYNKNLLLNPEFSVNSFIIDYFSDISNLSKKERSKKINLRFIQQSIADETLKNFVVTACTFFLKEVSKLTIVKELPQKEEKKTLKDIFIGLDFYDNHGRRNSYETGPSAYALATY
jgi:hypothetical protein